eukprot:641630-Rhodomonas_salina.1
MKKVKTFERPVKACPILQSVWHAGIAASSYPYLLHPTLRRHACNQKGTPYREPKRISTSYAVTPTRILLR